MQFLVLVVGIVAIGLIVFGERLLPGKPVALGVVALSIAAATLLGLPALGVPITGEIPAGLPTLAGPALRLRDVEGIVPLAAGCLLLAYIEGVSAARTFAAKHGICARPSAGTSGIGAANLAAAIGHGYPVAGGLSQSAVNDKAGARTPLALVFASVTLAFCLLFLTGLLENLPKAVLAAVVLTAVYGLLDFPALLRMWRVSRLDFSPRRSLFWLCCFLESCRASCLQRWPPSCCCFSAFRSRTSRFSAAFPAPTAIPIWTGIPRTSRCLA